MANVNPEMQKLKADLASIRAEAARLRAVKKQASDNLAVLRTGIDAIKNKMGAMRLARKNAVKQNRDARLAKAEARAKKAQERLDDLRRRANSPRAVKRRQRKAGPVTQVDAKAFEASRNSEAA